MRNLVYNYISVISLKKDFIFVFIMNVTGYTNLI